MIIDEPDVLLLRQVAEILRQGRVGDLVHEAWPRKVEELADRLERIIRVAKEKGIT